MRTGGFGGRGEGTDGVENNLFGIDGGNGGGSLAVVGTGPGWMSEMTPRARETIAGAEVVVGYRAYLDLIRPLLAGKEVLETGMRQETQRAQDAVARALTGMRVVVVSGGDPGVYGMAVPVLQAAAIAKMAVTVVPGVTAATAAAAALGAPLGHDFASVSLSDLLTPWSLIEKRLQAAMAADFVLVLYNPASSRRQKTWHRALAIIQALRPLRTPVGIVYNISREGERKVICDLAEIGDHPVDMRTTIVVGNSHTYITDGVMVTPRGYKYS